MGLPGLCGARALAMVQALVLQLGQQPCMLSVLLSHHRRWHGRATPRRTSPGCQPGRALQVLGRAMRCLRTISSIQRRICLAPDPKRTSWRMGQLLQHAVQSRRITGAMGMEQRRPRVDRNLFAPPEEMGPRRCLRRSLGQAPALHGWLGKEAFILHCLLRRWRHGRHSTIRSQFKSQPGAQQGPGSRPPPHHG